MFTDFFRDVVRPVAVIVILVFILGMVMDAVADTNTVASIEDRLSRLESTINSDENLREVYHGGKPVHYFETNFTTKIIQRLDRYPDGYVHIEKGKERKLLTASEAALSKTRTARIKQSRIDNLKSRIQTLESQTNATSRAQLEQAQRLLERLLASSITNEVNITIKPKPRVK